jgi:hypothetical protein
MLNMLFSTLFGCAHNRTTFPITPSHRSKIADSSSRKGTYVVCLDCGKEFDYNWKEMRIGSPRLATNAPAPVIAQTEHRVAH